jgi:hypothetical protein
VRIVGNLAEEKKLPAARKFATGSQSRKTDN